MPAQPESKPRGEKPGDQQEIVPIDLGEREGGAGPVLALDAAGGHDVSAAAWQGNAQAELLGEGSRQKVEKEAGHRNVACSRREPLVSDVEDDRKAC